MTTKGYKTATLRGLRLYGVPSMLVDTLRDADNAGLLSDADWKALDETPASSVHLPLRTCRDVAYAIGLRPEVCAAHREKLA